MDQSQIRRLIICGGGSAGWMTAALLRSGLPDCVEVQVIESEDIPIVGVGEATIPTIRHFNSLIGLDEKAFVKACQGTFKLGIEFTGWGGTNSQYFHGFGDFGPGENHVPAQWIFHKLKNAGSDVSLGEFSLPAQMAGAQCFVPSNVFAHPMMAEYSYAYHFDASLYARYLRGHCELKGVKRTNAKILHVNVNSESGRIEGLVLDDGALATADYFVDCTGFRSILLGAALKTGFVDWSCYLPANRAWAAPTHHKPGTPLRPYTIAQADSSGWQWHIPLQHRMGSGYVFSDRFISEEAALDRFFHNADATPLQDPKLLKFTTGRREQFWTKNCIAIGLAGGFLEPLESTSIHLLSLGAITLLDLFPVGGDDAISRHEYNKRMIGHYERVRDFITAHYHLNERSDGELWQYCQDMEIPDTLATKLEMYRHRGKILINEYEQFMTPSWISVLAAQGVFPEHLDPLVERLSLPQCQAYLSERRSQISQFLGRLPRHAEFIAQHCAAPQ